MEEIYQRTKLLLGEDIEKIKKTKICICGIGGVGSFSLEALARAGVGNIIIVDKDIVDITNINRQLIATVDNVGKPKTDIALKRIKDINPNINVVSIQEYIDEINICKYVTDDCDYVIDAIDSIESKIALKIISCMGMGNRLEPLKIKVEDIYKTEMCPLAKIIRKRLKQENIDNLKVVYSTEQPIKTNSKTLGSISYVPAVAGLVMASEVVKDIIEK